MSITIKRKRELYGSYSKLTILVDENKIGKIQSGEEKVIELPEETATLQVRTFPEKSKKIRVADGDIIKVSHASGASLLLVILIPIVFTATNYLTSFGSLGTTLLSLFIICLASIFFFNTFQLEKVQSLE